MFNFTPRGMRSSRMSNPLSAMTESPLSSKLSSPLWRVSSLSEMLPGYNFDTKVTAPDGDMPMSPL